jgi:hypothetical protein
MNAESLFLDTNVYIGYTLEGYFERFHSECCHIFDKVPNSRHTSLTVKQELDNRMNKRTKFFKTLLLHCLSGRQLKEFKIVGLKESEENLAEKIIAQAHKEGKADVEYVKGLQRMFFSRLLDALHNKTAKPFVPFSNDADMKDHFQFVVGIHPPDDSVLADFFSWALPGTGSCFITGDGLIDRKKEDILEYVRDKTLEGCSHLSMIFVRSAPKRYPIPL